MPRSIKPCILIVDDDLQVVKQLKWSLIDQFRVIHARSPEGLADLLHLHKPELALVDMHIPPHMESPETGLECVRLLRAEQGDLPIIGISVSRDATLPDAARRAGATGFLHKPFGFEQVAEVLQPTD